MSDPRFEINFPSEKECADTFWDAYVQCRPHREGFPEGPEEVPAILKRVLETAAHRVAIMTFQRSSKAYAALDAIRKWAYATSEGKAAAEVIAILDEYEQSVPSWHCIDCGEPGIEALCQDCADKCYDKIADLQRNLESLKQQITEKNQHESEEKEDCPL